MHQHFLGGGFGRRLESDMVVPAIAASKAVGKPVKLIYAREDDMQMDFTRPLTYQKVKVGLDASGKPIAMEHDVIGAWPTARWGIPAFLTPAVDRQRKGDTTEGLHDSFAVNGADYWYSIPNHTVRNYENKLAQGATPSGQLRSVAPAWTFWAVESTMDEIAHASGEDPVDMRLRLLDGLGANAGGDKPQNVGGAKRLANVLRAAVGRSGYGAVKLGPNEGMGVACVSSQERSSPTWTACVAHVKVDPKTGEVTLKKVTIAMDVGTIVNPDGVRAQIEGSVFWGASIALLEKGHDERRAARAAQLRQLHADADEPDTGNRRQHHRQRRAGGRLRRAGGDGHRSGGGQRHLQRGRRAGSLAADHGRSGQGGDESLSGRIVIVRVQKEIRERHPRCRSFFFVRLGIAHTHHDAAN